MPKERSPFKHDRTETLLRELAAKFIQSESNGTSLITITQSKLSRNGSRVLFFVSVLPAQQEVAAIDFLQRNRSAIRDYIKKNSKIGRIPFVEVLIDTGEKNRQRVDELLAEDENR